MVQLFPSRWPGRFPATKGQSVRGRATGKASEIFSAAMPSGTGAADEEGGAARADALGGIRSGSRRRGCPIATCPAPRAGCRGPRASWRARMTVPLGEVHDLGGRAEACLSASASSAAATDEVLGVRLAVNARADARGGPGRPARRQARRRRRSGSRLRRSAGPQPGARLASAAPRDADEARRPARSLRHGVRRSSGPCRGRGRRRRARRRREVQRRPKRRAPSARRSRARPSAPPRASA